MIPSAPSSPGPGPDRMSPKLAAIAAQARPLLIKHGVGKAAIFGSWARDEEHAQSDIDFLIEFEGSLLDKAILKLELEATLRRGVDLVNYRHIYHRIRDRVLAEQIPIL